MYLKSRRLLQVRPSTADFYSMARGVTVRVSTLQRFTLATAAAHGPVDGCAERFASDLLYSKRWANFQAQQSRAKPTGNNHSRLMLLLLVVVVLLLLLLLLHGEQGSETRSSAMSISVDEESTR
jgi:hypothetical protein